ncbi:MAG: hypothetical protein R2882_01245 [Gemmatimonadales bacterium]
MAESVRADISASWPTRHGEVDGLAVAFEDRHLFVELVHRSLGGGEPLGRFGDESDGRRDLGGKALGLDEGGVEGRHLVGDPLGGGRASLTLASIRVLLEVSPAKRLSAASSWAESASMTLTFRSTT